MCFDRVIVSSNDDPLYLQFWPLVAAAWKKFFDCKVSLAFVSNDCSPELFDRLSEHGEVDVFPEVEGVPTSNLAMIARYQLAAMFPYDICLINDIDCIPLQRKYVLSRTAQRPYYHLMTVGTDLFEGPAQAGKFPISNMTGEGALFGRMFDPRLFDTLKTMRIFDQKEAITNPHDCFCDESLFRALLHVYRIPTQYINIGMDIHKDTIDRSWWGPIDEVRLKAGGYIECHMPRPLDEYWDVLKPVIDYICGPVKKEDIIFQGGGVKA